MRKGKMGHIIRNSDNENLMPKVYSGVMVLGYVDEVNGEGAKETPEFIPTRDELLQLVKYWVKEIIHLDWFYFNTGFTDSSEIRISAFAKVRINRIGELVDKESFDSVIDEVLTQVREEQGQDLKLWQIFREGDKTQWDMVQDEFNRCMSKDSDKGDVWAFSSHLVLTSTAFRNGDSVPKRYTSEGENVSPPLSWSQPPSGTKSLAITLVDLDSSSRVFPHWIIFNIPPDYRNLTEGIPAKGRLADGALQGKNEQMQIGYYGPNRAQPFRRYQFNIYALDQSLNLTAGISKKQLLDAMEGHVLDEGQLTVIY